MSELPPVSVVIPSRDRAELLAACVESLARQDYPRDRYEVLAVDAGSADGAADRVGEVAERSGAPRVRCLTAPSHDANAARNLGMREAAGELIVLVDDDVVAPPGWLRALAAASLRRPDVECLGGPVRPVFTGRAPRTCASHDLAGAAFDEGPVEAEVGEVWGCNMALRRTALEHVGPFREGLPVQQEWEWEQRLLSRGGRILYVPEAWIWHHRLPSDLRVGTLLHQFFLRGYVKGMLGQPVVPRAQARDGAASLAHGVRARCTYGLTGGARKWGLVCGSLARSRGRRLGGPAGTAEGTGRVV